MEDYSKRSLESGYVLDTEDAYMSSPQNVSGTAFVMGFPGQKHCSYAATFLLLGEE